MQSVLSVRLAGKPWVFLGSCLIALLPQFVSAQDWQAAIAEAKSQVAPIPDTQVAEAREELEAAVQRVNELFEQWEEENRWGWEDYLYWLDLVPELEKPEMDLALLRRTNANLRRKHEGLELPQFLQLRAALQRYIELESFKRRDDETGDYIRLIDELGSAVSEAQANLDPETYSKLGRIAGTLDAAGQAPQLVALVRESFGQANLIARVSGDFISKNATQPVDDTRPVSEMILGTHQTGEARTVGQVRMRTVPNHQVAEIEAILEGTTQSENVGTRPVGRLGTVVIDSDSHSQVQAKKRIQISDGELTSHPAAAHAKTRSQIHRVCAPKLIAKLATRQVYKNKHKAERIAAQRLSRRLENSFDERVAEALNTANENFTSEVHTPLIRLDAHPEDIAFSTTESSLEMKVRQAGRYQVAAGSQPPALDQDADAALVVHQTAVNNLAEAVFGGKTITDRLAAEWIEIANQGDLPEAFRLSPDQPWSITLATYLPITVDLRDSQVTVRIRGSRFKRGNEVVNETIEVKATYAIEKTQLGVKLTRVGDVELSYPGKTQLTVEQTATKSFLLEKFKSLFKDEVETTGVRFPGRFADKAPMQLSVFAMSEGWLTLAWQQADETPTASDEAVAAQ